MASKKSPARKPRIKAASVTSPKKTTKKVYKLPPSKKSPTPKKKAAKKSEPVTKVDARRVAKRAAKKLMLKPVVEHIIDKMANAPSVVRAVRDNPELDYEQTRDLMQQPGVQLAVAERRAMSLAAECGITSQKIMTQYAALGFSTMKRYGKLLTAENVITELSELSDADAAAIQELTTETYWDDVAKRDVKRVKVKLYPKEIALHKMAQHLGIKGFGGQLGKAGVDRVGMQTVVGPDGTVTSTVIVQSLPDEELERIALGLEDGAGYDERAE